jgi:proteic killer suppression protein
MGNAGQQAFAWRDPVRKGLADAAIRRERQVEFGGLNPALARQRLAELNAAPSLEALKALKSIGLHKLKGDRAGYWAVRVNGPWRIVFRFRTGDAYDVEIVDYH